MLLRSILAVTRRYPLTRGRDFFFRNFADSLAAYLASIPNPVATRRGFPVFCNPRDYTSDWIKVWGEHERRTESFLLDHLRNGGAFLDIGANVGYFSLLVAHELGDKCPVVAFEPNPPIFSLLRSGAGASRHARAIRPIQAAVSDVPGEMAMVIDRGNSGHSQLCSKAGGGPTVPVLKLDTWFVENPLPSPVAAIKLDVEGCELKALRGMENTLRQDRPALVVECDDEHLRQFRASAAELRAYIESLDYREELAADMNLYYVPAR